MRIRPEVPADAEPISSLIERAFAPERHSSHTEQFIVQGLRSAGVLSISLVAEREGIVIGHIAFSPVSISNSAPHWYGLGPLAVRPENQRQGVGCALVRAGIDKLLHLRASGCVVLGDPAYYGRFGFQAVPSLVYPGPPPEFFMAQEFSGSMPQGEVAYHAAFASEA